jgi:nucleotide-binding universal stress UspA family protein
MAHDLSRRSSIALERAVQLARRHGAELEVLHIVENDLPAAVIERRRSEAAHVIEAELPAGLRVPGRSAVNVVTGRDYSDILSRAETSHVDLIVLGAHREDALRPVVVGTTAERTIGLGTRPILIVKNPPTGLYGRVEIAVDFTASARQAAAFAFALLPDAEFCVVHVASVTDGRAPAGTPEAMEKIKSDLRRFLPAPPAGTELTVRHGWPAAEIREVANRFEAELLVVGGQHRSGLTRTLIGAIPEDLLAVPPCDLLVVHA